MCDFNDNAFAKVTSVAAACGGKCSETQKCTHFAWTTLNGGTCALKKGNVSKDDAFVTNDPSMVCGIVYDSQHQTENSTVSWNGQNWATSCDFIDNDLSNIAVSPQVCGAKCVETNECTHYVWSRWAGGTCFLKTGDVSKDDALFTNDPTMVCGIINGSQYGGPNSTVSWNGNNWAMSCDFIDNDFANIIVKAELCGSTCARTQECTHFTWSMFNNGTCWLKHGNVSKDNAFFINDPTAICGIMNSSQYGGPNSTVSWNGNTWAMSCDFIGNDLSNSAVTVNVCGPTCVRTQGCTHFTWTSLNGGTCWMKYGNVSKNDAFVTNDPTMVCGVI